MDGSRLSETTSDIVTWGNVSVSRTMRVAWVDGKKVTISIRDAEILSYLILRRGLPAKRQQMAKDLYRKTMTWSNSLSSVGVYISRLRRKYHIQVKRVNDMGYWIDPLASEYEL